MSSSRRSAAMWMTDSTKEIICVTRIAWAAAPRPPRAAEASSIAMPDIEVVPSLVLAGCAPTVDALTDRACAAAASVGAIAATWASLLRAAAIAHADSAPALWPATLAHAGRW